MSRNYANIVTSIWRDREFCAMSAGAQRTYFMLLSQPDITAAGVLPLTVNRWAKTVPESERHLLAGWLNELAEHGYICIDTEAEELLVRSFIRWDRGYNNPKRQPVIRESMSLVTSPDLQSVLRSESVRLGFDYGESLPQVNSLYRNQGKAIPENDDLDRLKAFLKPQPTTHNPQELHRPTTSSDAFETFWSTYPRKDAKRKAEGAFRAALKRADAQTITAGAQRYADDPNRDPGYTAMPASWLNADRWGDEPIRRPTGIRAGPAQSTTDQRVGAGLALAAELDAEAKSQRPQLGA